MVKTLPYFNIFHILFKLKQYLYIFFSCSISIFSTQTCSFLKGEDWFAALTNLAILKKNKIIGGKLSRDRYLH